MNQWKVRLFAIGCLCLLAAGALAQDNDGPPKLKRGRPSGTADTTSTSESSRTAAPTPATVPTRSQDQNTSASTSSDARDSGAPSLRRGTPQAPIGPPLDAFLEKAREAAFNFTDGLPN